MTVTRSPIVIGRVVIVMVGVSEGLSTGVRVAVLDVEVGVAAEGAGVDSVVSHPTSKAAMMVKYPSA